MLLKLDFNICLFIYLLGLMFSTYLVVLIDK
jgi:hypothetical protein